MLLKSEAPRERERERERESKRLRRFVTSFFLILSLILQNFLFLVNPVYASTNTWDFSTAVNYTYDNTKIEFSSGQAQLKATSNWYNASWSYRRAITVDNTSNSTNLTNFQVEIKLTSSNFDYTKANSDGSDIRFTDSNGTTLIDHWTEAYDSTNQEAYFMVEIPSITASSSKTIYIYYGNTGASSTSSWDNTFTTSTSSPSAGDIYTQSTYDAFPGAELLSNGDLVVAFRTGSQHVSTDGKLILARSTDGGTVWSTTTAYDDITIDDRTNLGLTQISDGTLILPFVQHNGTDPTTAFVIKSTDNGQTWGSPIVISNPLTGWIFPYGKIIELPDSTLLLSVYGKNTGETTKSLLMQSTDAGATWSLKSTIANDAANNYNETDVLRLDANNYLAVIRRTASPDNVYKVTSSDGGNTWGSPTLLFEGVSPDLVELNNGDILLCVGDRSGTEGIRCQISQNDGLTWSNGTMIFTGPAGQTSNGGYPASFQLSNGNIFTTYYHLISGANTDVSRTIYSEDYILNSNTNNFFEGMEDGNLNDWAVAQGTTTSVSSSIKHSGTYSFYHNDTDTLIQNRGVRSLYSTGQSTGVVSFWLYPDTYSFTFGLNDGTVTGSDERFWLSIHPDGSVKYHNGTAWTSLSTATTLSADTWSKFTIKFNASTNQAEVFINGSSKGNITQRFTGGNISHIEFGTWSTVGTGYVFYVDDIYIHQYVSTMPSSSVGSQVSIYDSNNPIINPTVANAQPFTSLSGFSETATKNGGQIKYQISNDSGTTWYWYNPGWTTTSSGYTEANTASDINSNISTFPVGSGSFLFKAYLNSDGTQLVQLDSVNLTYINDITGPTVSAVSSTPTSAGATITWTTNEDSSSKVDYGLTNSYGSTTTETDTTTRVQTHSVTLSGLSSCTTYHYRARSIDAALN
ncbi:hypothetical protein A2775_01040 [Candidatus Curtissbacteria bacterium RIFCSPHIGHO2_01_FULL_39_57]|nr:MAG: hypothetical protein A2775_01040 [Candidatus Curtissbacteria bacterium RIFCSPHIGHO2_01_FULL_39_57]